MGREDEGLYSFNKLREAEKVPRTEEQHIIARQRIRIDNLETALSEVLAKFSDEDTHTSVEEKEGWHKVLEDDI